MFPPLLCFVLLFGLLLCFPLSIFPLPVVALKERLNFREQDVGKGLYLVIGNPRAVVIGLLSARHGIPPLKLPLVEQIALKHRAISCDEAAPCILGYLFGGRWKGGGSAYGGKWRPNPNKPQDQRYWGKPGEIKTTIMRNGEIFRTKIGNDGRAEIERHETDHNRGDKHTNPHDHKIDWNTPDEHPMPGPPINYPGGAPEFKQYVRIFSMDNYIIVPDGSMNFETISEFKRSLSWGAEIEFVWNNVTYGVIRYGTNNKITIYQANRPETEKVCDTADDALEYMLGDDRLRDVITKVNVTSRTI